MHTRTHTSSVAAHYNDLDRFYREIWGEHVHHGFWQTGQETRQEAVENLIRKVAGAGALEPGQTVYDIGAGYGASARFLAEHYRADVTAITVSDAQYAYARSLAPKPGAPRYLLGDFLEVPLPDLSGDLAIAIESTEHMHRPSFFEKAYRILRSGGRIVVCAWLSSPSARPWETRHLLTPIRTEGKLDGLATAEDYLQWMDESKFKNLVHEDITASVSRTWSHCVTGMASYLAKNPWAWRFLLDPKQNNRVFALTVARIWLAYRTGAMQFAIFSGTK